MFDRDHGVMTEKKIVVIRKLLTDNAVITVESIGVVTKRNHQGEKLWTCDLNNHSVTTDNHT